MEEREPPLAAQAPSQPAFAHALVQTDAGSVARLCVVLQSNPPTMYVSHGGATWCAEKSAHKDHEQGQHVTKGNHGAQQPKTKYTFRPTTAAASPPNPSHLDLSIMHSVQHGRAYGQNRTTPQRLAVDLNVEDQTRSSTAHLHPEGKQRRSVNSSNGPQSATPPPPSPPPPPPRGEAQASEDVSNSAAPARLSSEKARQRKPLNSCHSCRDGTAGCAAPGDGWRSAPIRGSAGRPGRAIQPR